MNLSRGVRSARDRAVSSHAFLRVTASIRPERTARHRAMQVALVTSSFASDLAGPDDGDLRLALADRVRAPLLDLPETEGLELRLPLDEAEPIPQERRGVGGPPPPPPPPPPPRGAPPPAVRSSFSAAISSRARPSPSIPASAVPS